MKKYTRTSIVIDGEETLIPRQELFTATVKNLWHSIGTDLSGNIARGVMRMAIPLATGYALTGDLSVAKQLSLFQGIIATSGLVTSAIPKQDKHMSKFFGRIVVPSIVSGLYYSLYSGQTGIFVKSVETALTNAVSSMFTDEVVGVHSNRRR